MEVGRDPPELLDEDRDAGPCAQAQRPFDSAADGQPASDMIDGDVPAEQKQRVQRDLRWTYYYLNEKAGDRRDIISLYLRDVAQEHLGGRLDALKADDDAGAPSRLRELHARGVHPHPRPAHIRRAPFVRPRVPLDRPARDPRKFHRVAREGDARDARVQRREEERLEQRVFARVRVEFRG